MTSEYRRWSGPARALARAVDAGVSAALAADAPAFASALSDLDRVDHEQLVAVLGTLARDLLERNHPDGLDADDVSAVLQRCALARSWYPAYDTDALIRALTDLLGVGDADNQPDVAPAAVLAHGVLLVADLLYASGLALPPVLDDALAELYRAQTMELP